MSELLEELDAAINAAKGAGADVSEADALRQMGKAHLLRYHEVEAIDAIQRALSLTDEVHRRRVEQLLLEAREILDQAGAQCPGLDDTRKYLTNAEVALNASDYGAAIWLMNKAIQSMGEGVRARTEALDSMVRNQLMYQLLRCFEPVPDTLVDALGSQEDLVARGEYGDSLGISERLSREMEDLLASHVKDLLSKSKGYADELKRAGLRSEARRARKGYRMAHRYARRKETRRAITILIELEQEHNAVKEGSRLSPGIG